VSELASQRVTNWAGARLASLRERECAPASHPPPTIVDLRSSPMIAHLDHIVDDILGGSGALSLDALVDRLGRLLGQPKGELRVPAKFVDVLFTDARVGRVGVQLSDLRLRGLDAAFGLALCEPVAPRLLTHSAGVGGYAPLRAAVHLRLLLGGSWHNLELELALHNVSLDLATPLVLDRYALGSVSLAQLLHAPGCLAAPLVNLSLAPAASNLTVHAPRAGGIDLAIVRTGHDGVAMVPGLLPLLALLAPGVSQLVDDSLGGLLGKMHASCSGVPYEPQLPPPQPATDNWANVLIALLILAVPALLAALALTLAVRKARRRRRRARALGLTVMPLSAAKLARQQDAPDSRLGHVTRIAAAAAAAAAADTPAAVDAPAAAAAMGTTDGLTSDGLTTSRTTSGDDPELVTADAQRRSDDGSPWESPSPPWLLCPGDASSLSQQPMYRHSMYALLVPLLISANLVLFLVSAVPPLGIGASVDVDVTVAGEPVALPGVFSFSLPGTVGDAWAAGLYPFSLVVALMSGVWPYAKLMLMLWCWWAPASCMPSRRCEQLLCTVDALGKWALLDFDMMMMMAVAFRLHLSLPAGDDDDVAPLDVRVQVTPRFGIFGYLSACLLSLATSNALLALQRRAVVAAAAAAAAEGSDLAARAAREGRPSPCELGEVARPPRHAVRAYRFGSLRGDGVAPLPAAAQLGVAAALLGCGLAIGYGASVETFSIELGGLVGALMGPEHATRSYSVVSLGAALPYISSRAAPMSLNFFACLFLCVCLVLPLLWLLLLALLWLLPLRPATQRRLLVAAEVAQAWAALDVFLLTVLVSLFSLEQYAQFLLGDECDGLNTLLARQYFAPLVHGDARCFEVHNTFGAGMWILCAASLVQMALGNVVMHASRAALDDHERHLGRSLHGAVQRERAVPLAANGHAEPLLVD